MKLVFKIIAIHYEKQKKNFSENITSALIDWIFVTEFQDNPYLSPDLKTCLILLVEHDCNIEYPKINNDCIYKINKYISSRPVILGIKGQNCPFSTTDFFKNFTEDFVCFTRFFKYLSFKYERSILL